MARGKEKFLLIKPPYEYYPVGLSYVASTLERHDIPYDFLDLSIPGADLIRHIKHGDYFAVGAGGLVADYFTLENLFKQVKSFQPNMPCILGGLIAKDVSAEAIFKHTPIDVAVIGEAEITLPRLIEVMKGQDCNYRSINGVIYRGVDGLPVTNTPQKRIDPMIDRVFPSFEFFDHSTWPVDQKPIPVLTGRGCPGACTFCSPSHRKFLPRHFEDIFIEIETLVSRFKVKRIDFINEVIFSKEEELIDFCGQYKKRINLPFTCLIRLDIDPKVLPVMKDAGCVKLGVGVESGSDKILRSMGKGITADQIRQFVSVAKQCGLTYFESGWMFNNEMETQEDIDTTLAFQEELDIRSGFSYTIPYPGTVIYKRARKKELITDEYQFLKTLPFFYIAEFIPDMLFLQTPEGQPLLPNLTDISANDFVSVMRNAFVRFVKRYALKATHLSKKGDAIFIHGECPVCNETLDFEFNLLSPVRRNLACPNVVAGTCYNDLMFHAHVFALPSMVSHIHKVTEHVASAARIGIFGDNYIIKFLLAHGIFNIMPERIVGISNRMPEMIGGHVYFDSFGNLMRNSEILDPRGLIAHQPDLILAAEMPPGSSAIVDVLVREGYEAGKVLPICPNSLLPG